MPPIFPRAPPVQPFNPAFAPRPFTPARPIAPPLSFQEQGGHNVFHQQQQFQPGLQSFHHGPPPAAGRPYPQNIFMGGNNIPMQQQQLHSMQQPFPIPQQSVPFMGMARGINPPQQSQMNSLPIASGLSGNILGMGAVMPQAQPMYVQPGLGANPQLGQMMPPGGGNPIPMPSPYPNVMHPGQVPATTPVVVGDPNNDVASWSEHETADNRKYWFNRVTNTR